MNNLNNDIKNYIEYCEYRKRLDSKTLKAYRIDLKQYEIFSVFVWISIAVKRQYDHGKRLFGAGFQFKRFSLLSL